MNEFKAFSETELLLYTTPDGQAKIDVLYGSENIWLSQGKMAILFGVNCATQMEGKKQCHPL